MQFASIPLKFPLCSSEIEIMRQNIYCSGNVCEKGSELYSLGLMTVSFMQKNIGVGYVPSILVSEQIYGKY